MGDFGHVNGFQGEQSIHHLLGERVINAENGLGGRVFHHGKGLGRITLQFSGYPLCIQHHLYRAHQNTAQQRDEQYPSENAVSEVVLYFKGFLHPLFLAHLSDWFCRTLRQDLSRGT